MVSTYDIFCISYTFEFSQTVPGKTHTVCTNEDHYRKLGIERSERKEGKKEKIYCSCVKFSTDTLSVQRPCLQRPNSQLSKGSKISDCTSINFDERVNGEDKFISIKGKEASEGFRATDGTENKYACNIISMYNITFKIQFRLSRVIRKQTL